MKQESTFEYRTSLERLNAVIDELQNIWSTFNPCNIDMKEAIQRMRYLESRAKDMRMVYESEYGR